MQDMQTCKSPEETQEFAAQLLHENSEIQLWLLTGDLASGKTTFVQGFARALGQEQKPQSPTFAYVREYQQFVHYDLYRLKEPSQEINELIEEHLSSGKKVLIEWPEGRMAELEIPRIHLQFEHAALGERRITIEKISS